VRLTASIDVAQRVAIWTLTALDPETNAIPVDPSLGFLPVNNATGRGQGFVNYTIRAPASCPNGENVQAQAQITFDANTPLATNVETNHVDSRAPASHVLPVEALDTTLVRVRWTGADGDSGAGLQSVALYDRPDARSSFQLVAANLTGSELTLALPWGHAYEFFTTATDAAGNVEATKTNADATIVFGTLGVDSTLLVPRAFLLYPAAPNPFRTGTLLRFDLPVATEVTLEVFDVAGRRVAVPVKTKWMLAGRYSVTFRPDRMESGLFFCRMRAGRFERTTKMVLVK
jgi:hypothetical protein